jgi:hypothetical protein
MTHRNIRSLLDPLLSGKADVVYGSRFLGGRPHRVVYFWHMVGNRFLTLLSNMLTNLNLTDMETCYKVFRREALANIVMEQPRPAEDLARPGVHCVWQNATKGLATNVQQARG